MYNMCNVYIIYIHIYIMYIYIEREGERSSPFKNQTSHSFLSTTKYLGKIRRLGYTWFLHFLLILIVFKNFLNKKKLTVLKKCQFFSYSLLSKMLKFRRSSLRLVFFIKIAYNQFLLLKNYRLWH